MNLREYYYQGFSKNKLIHFLVVLSISLLIGVIYFFVATFKFGLSKAIVLSNTFFAPGVTLCCYSIVLPSFLNGLGSTIFKARENRRIDTLKNKIESERYKSSTIRKTENIVAWEKEYERLVKQKEINANTPRNNLIYYYMLLIGVVLCLIALIIYFAMK
ncbi:hypothetical protein [Mycoplasmopsis opalescens]|uniref:hypothetical protein n=1 Tax=Mycoplasmopsis opalescens TaxID=114886 RepID=UPI0004A6AC1E|nr:hypothetical protein [Mycoplasmopsis opalescens]